jgi:aminoglycoside 6'-N-acetyltransferase I
MTPRIRLVELTAADSSARRQAAELLVEAFPHANGWPTIEDATDEVTDLVTPERRCRAAIDDDDQLVGWICGTPGNRGRVWELHPLVVRASARGQGIGRALVQDLERLLGAEGALTLWVGNKLGARGPVSRPTVVRP